MISLHIADSCEVNNGGCDENAVCSHDATTNAVKCTCKTGYTNTGSASNVTCTGKSPSFWETFLISAIYLRIVHTTISFRRISVNKISVEARYFNSSFSHRIDSCLVKNGGCDINALCSHHSRTNAVKCTCKTGYTNTGSDSQVICTGEIDIDFDLHTYQFLSFTYFLDSCRVKNGGCDVNAICSHETSTFEVQCTCKIGYTNTGSDSNVTCTGNVFAYGGTVRADRCDMSKHLDPSLLSSLLLRSEWSWDCVEKVIVVDVY